MHDVRHRIDRKNIESDRELTLGGGSRLTFMIGKHSTDGFTHIRRKKPYSWIVTYAKKRTQKIRKKKKTNATLRKETIDQQRGKEKRERTCSRKKGVATEHHRKKHKDSSNSNSQEEKANGITRQMKHAGFNQGSVQGEKTTP